MRLLLIKSRGENENGWSLSSLSIYFCTTDSFVRYYMENKKENPFKLVCARFFPLSKVMVYRPQVKS